MQRMSTVRVCSALVHFVSEVLVRNAWVQYVCMDAVHVRSAVYAKCCVCGVLCMLRSAVHAKNVHADAMHAECSVCAVREGGRSCDGRANEGAPASAVAACC